MSAAPKNILPALLRNLRAGAKSWDTTLLGIAIIAYAIWKGDLEVEHVLAGLIGLLARSAGVSSEESGLPDKDKTVQLEPGRLRGTFKSPAKK